MHREDSQESLWDSDLATAIEIAVRDFGGGVLDQQRLIGILKDYHAFRQMTYAEHITRTLIGRHFLLKLKGLTYHDKEDVHAAVCRESISLANEYGYSVDKVERTIVSILAGIGYNSIDEITKTTGEPITNDRESISSSFHLMEASNKNPKPESDLVRTLTGSNQDNVSSRKKTSGSNKKKTSYGLGFFLVMAVAIWVIVFCLTITYLSNKTPREESVIESKENPLPRRRTENEIRDSIYRAIDSIRRENGLRPIFYISSRRAKGSGRYNQEYESAYEEGYDDGIADKRFTPKETKDNNKVYSGRKGNRGASYRTPTRAAR